MTKKILVGYGIVSISLAVFSFFFIDQNFSYLHILYHNFQTHKVLLTFIYTLFLVLLFGLYYVSYIQTQNNNLSWQLTKRIIGLVSLILFFAYPAMLSYDLFSYIAYAKVLTVYHENPYIIMPYQFIGDPILNFTRYANLTLQYGLSWLLLSVIPYVLGLGNYLVILFNFKLLAILFYGGTIYLLGKLTKDTRSVVLFALNPLVLLEIVASGHNDIVMMFFALAAFYFVQKKRYFIALLAILLSIGVKFVTIILLPVLIVIAYKQWKKQKINWERMYFVSGLLMTLMFLLSFIHREIYSWYVVWIFVFAVLCTRYNYFFYLALTLSVTMLMTYIPDIYLGTYTPQGQLLKLFLALAPVIVFSIIGCYSLVERKRLLNN